MRKITCDDGGKRVKVTVGSIGAYQDVFRGNEVEFSLFQGATLQHLLEAMIERWGLDLFSEVEKMENDQSQLVVLINGRHMGTRGGLHAFLSEGDLVIITFKMYGG